MSETSLTFDGSNWQDLTRLITSARMTFIQDSGRDEDKQRFTSDESRCAYLSASFRGPALDWVGQAIETNPQFFVNYDVFIINVRNGFGISDEGLGAQRRGELEGLRWNVTLPTFFAEFDRLTQLLNLTGDDTKIALLRNKLPSHVTKLLAEQALNFHDYGTMRERLLTMWSLDPGRSIGVGASAPNKTKRPRCGRCGKKGHTAAECRTKN